MSQRYLSVNEEVDVTFNLKVTLKQLSNHDGFGKVNLQDVFEDFRENIADYLKDEVKKEYYNVEFSDLVDTIAFNVEIK